jgi:hypothetical protein
VRLMTSPTTPCAMTFGSEDGCLRLPRFFPLGQPPSLAFLRAASVLALDFTLPSSVPTFISFPQCGHFIAHNNTNLFAMNHEKNQSSPLPKVLVRETTHRAAARVAQTALALERWRLTNGGKLPESLFALLPQFMPAVPTDPFDGQPLRFRQTETGYVVYSVGPDANDDGGVAKGEEGAPEDVTFIVERP